MVGYIYWILVYINFLVVVLGTGLYLAGVFRSCWCERIFAADSALIELNRKTQEAFDNADRYWKSTTYVAFGVVWIICLVAMAFRWFITMHMDDLVKVPTSESES